MGMKKVRDKGERFSFKREIGELRKELRTREATAISQVLKSADVVLSTNTGNTTVLLSTLIEHNREKLRPFTVCVCVHLSRGLQRWAP